ncbi:NTE family protein RssA [Planctomycetes bacterium CA13]|uniref:NTE family protein RssA n=1 Tax=Novipirellula herctigrandis TaxID=2527986 RepID=A0A5C5ZCR4_9BACT|nr:NTE family protein RssA [Planctomycetes bacterium CA13]
MPAEPRKIESTPIDRLRPCRICEGLGDREIERVAAACTWRELQPDETLAFPCDSVFAIYTVTRGRLRMYQASERADVRGEQERLIGFANFGDTIGQSSLLSDQFDDNSRIVSDTESQVAVISRARAMRLMMELPRLRQNLIVTFGLRMESLFQGKPLRRFPKVVGIVSSQSSNKSLCLLRLLTQELQKRNERICVFSDRSEVALESETMREALSGNGVDSASLIHRVRQRLAGVDRVLVDIMLPGQSASFSEQIHACGEILWCFDNEQPEANNDAILANFIAKHPPLKSRIACVQIVPTGKSLGRRKPCCENLDQRDFLLALSESDDQLSRLCQQGIDRIVRHLRGVKIGLALGGGGARGLAHLGVLKVLDHAGISFDMMSGTSAGAMIGLGYAAGMTPESLIDLFARELQPPTLLDRFRGGRRLFLFVKFRAGAWEQMLRKHYHDWLFGQLHIPFSVVTTDLVSGQELVRDSGDIVHAILESINIPVMSNPILKDGKILVDGGVLNNLPVELLSDRGAQHVIGVDVSKEIPNHFAGNYPGMATNKMIKPGNVETAYRIMEVSRRGITQLQMSFADHVIEPDTSAFDFADFTSAAGIAETGEVAAETMLPDIQAAYNELMNG